MLRIRLSGLVLLSLILVSACSDNGQEEPGAKTISSTSDISENDRKLITESTPISVDAEEPRKTTRDTTEFQRLYKLIVYGQANLAQVKTALKTEDVGEMVNVIHALYSMRWLRGVNGMLDAMWQMDKEAFPEFNWNNIEKTPVRIAIASTINRIKVFDTQEYREFIRRHKYDDHEFHRAQVAVALGLNQDPKDIGYLQEMADGDNLYVSQSAITSLALMNHERASEALVKLANKHKNTPRGQLIIEVLDKAYNLVPSDKPPEEPVPTG